MSAAEDSPHRKRRRRRRHRHRPLTDAQILANKKRNRKRRLVVYGCLIGGLWAGYVWQPWEFDVIQKFPAQPDPKVDVDQPKLFAKGTKVLVVTAHPDDSEFYVGGTLTRLAKTANIHQVICTDGDKAYYWIFTNANENREVRRTEAQQALNTWHGSNLSFLGHPDGRLRANDNLVREIKDEIAEFKPDYVLAFDGNYPPRFSHQDHRRAGDAAYAACEELRMPLWLMQFSTSAPNAFVDITDQWDAKAKLLAVHKSQFSGERLQRVTNMVASLAEMDGEKNGTTYAEGFRCTKFGG